MAACRSCRRPLTAPASIKRGRGRTCHARHLAAIDAKTAAGYTAAQLAKARELIADRGLVPLKRHGFYQAVSSDGATTYLVCRQRCNCPAGLHETRCYHRLAVAITEARQADAITEAWKAAA
jgi:hypothetical protein